MSQEDSTLQLKSESATPSIISLVHLTELDPNSNSFITALRDTLYSKAYPDFIKSLSDDETFIYIDWLDQVLNYVRADTVLFHKCQRALRKICSKSGRTPSSHEIPKEQLAVQNENPAAYGGFSEVLIGTFGDRLVALKCLKINRAEKLEGVKKALSKEVVAWKHLFHPNILPLLGVSEVRALPCIVTEWMPHGTIVNYLIKNPNKNRLALLSDIAKGLEYLHSSEVVHGDLKGANILIDNSGHARLSDFGLNSITNDEDSFNASSIGNERGTARWIAPELLNVSGTNTRPNNASDIYSLAMVVVEIFSGKVPFPKWSNNTVIFRVVNGATPPRPDALDLSDKLWEMVERCWQKEPKKRPEASVVLKCFERAHDEAELSATFETKNDAARQDAAISLVIPSPDQSINPNHAPAPAPAGLSTPKQELMTPGPIVQSDFPLMNALASKQSTNADQAFKLTSPPGSNSAREEGFPSLASPSVASSSQSVPKLPASLQASTPETTKRFPTRPPEDSSKTTRTTQASIPSGASAPPQTSSFSDTSNHKEGHTPENASPTPKKWYSGCCVIQ